MYTEIDTDDIDIYRDRLIDRYFKHLNMILDSLKTATKATPQ